MHSVCKLHKTWLAARSWCQAISSLTGVCASSLSWLASPDLTTLLYCCTSGLQSTMKSLFGRALSPTLYLLLAILQIMQYCCNADAGSIDIAPVTQHANLSNSDYATFYCRATGRNTLWNIHDRNYDSGNRTEDDYVFREVIVHQHANENIVHDMFLDIQTSLENNGTIVRCIAFVDTPSISGPAELIVQGGPSAPDVTLRLVNDRRIILEWSAPFTWPHTTIQHYVISSNRTLPDNFHPLLYKNTSLEFNKTSESEAVCIVYSFSVTANNGLADGETTTVTGGFPVAPRMLEDPIKTDVTFTSDRSPVIMLSIKLPVVCGFQQVRYNLVLRNLDSEVLHEEGPNVVLYSDSPVIHMKISENELIKMVQHVVAEATFNVVGVEEDMSADLSATNTFSVVLNLNTLDSTEQPTVLSNEQVVLIASVGGAALLIVLVFAIVVLAACIYRKRKSAVYCSGSPHVQKSPMVTNPIYEGQSVYETIDPHFRQLSFTSSTSLPPPPTPTYPPIVESPYAHTQVDPAYAHPPPHPIAPAEDGYTVMASAGGLGKEMADLGESNLDSSVARYVPDPSMLMSEC